jgi:hypothetical protein
MQISRSKSDSLHRTPAGFTTLAIDGDGLRECLPARPTSAASYPISVMIFLWFTRREPSQEPLEEDLDRIEHHLDEARRERGEL